METREVLGIFKSQLWTLLRFAVAAAFVVLLVLCVGVPAVTGRIVLCDGPTDAQRFVRSVTGAQFVYASCTEKPIETTETNL